MPRFEDLIAPAPRLRRSVIDDVTGNPVVTSAPTGDVVQRSSILPVGRDDDGNLVPALPQAVFDAIDAARFPGQVARGEVSIFDPRTGHVSDEAIGKAANIAGLAMTGSMPFEAPAGAVRIFGGRAARTADRAALDKAADLQASGAAPDAIWGETGWGIGRDGVARFEIPDDAAKLRPHDGSGSTTLGQVLDHPALFEAYPAMRDVRVFHRPELGSDAAANPTKNWIAANLDDAQALPALLHEGQHIVQRTEGFAPGASPIDPALAAHPQVAEVASLRQRLAGLANPQAEALASRADQAARLEAYRTAAGEVEARNVEARQGMTPAERSASPPWRTQDVPADRQWLPRSGGVTGDAAQLRSGAPSPSLNIGGPSGAIPAAAVAGTGTSQTSQGARTMPGIFDDLLATPAPDASATAPSSASGPAPSPSASPQSTSAPAPGKRPGIFDDLLALPPQGDAASKPSTAADVIQSAGAGLIRGAAGFLDFPQTAYELLDKGAGIAAQGVARGVHALGGPVPASDQGGDTRMTGLLPTLSGLPKPGENAIRGLEAATGKLYEPQTRAGKFAQAATEFIPGAGKKLADVIAMGVIPGLASEGAGQVTQGSALETPARVVAGLATALGGAAFRAPSNAAKQVAGRTEAATAAQVDQAEALFQDAAAHGLPLTRANALDAVTNGATSLGDLQRFVEGRGKLRGFFAPTAEGVAREGQSALDSIAPAGAQPAVLGGEVQDAARAAVAQTPQGQALTQAREAAGPRVTPEEAGQVIQPALQQAYDRREGMRAALGEQDYAAARRAPETVGVERQVAVERPGEPVVTEARYSRPQFTDAAPRPLDPPPTVEAQAGAGPESLARFIAKNGGIRLDGEAAATDLHRFNIPGLGNVARADGKGIDNFWRERLIEEGYFRPDADGGMARDITNDLLRRLQNEQRGVPSYPIGQERTAAAARAKPGQVQDEYRAALSEAETRLDGDLARAGVDPATLHPDVRSRVLGAMMRGEEADPLRAYERTVAGMKEQPAPFSKSTAVEETIPDVRFGQANPQPVVDHIDRLLETAKGPAAKALSDARRTLLTRGGQDLDLSVEGLHNSRDAINDLIGKAEPSAQRVLMGVRDRLDQALTAVPEYEHARSGFAAASRNLDPFADGSALGSVVARDQQSGRSLMPTERVPDKIAEGPTPARAFNEVAPPEARQAMEGRLTTQVLDAVTDQPGATSAQGIRTALRQHEDLFRQFPGARDRLQAIASAHDGIETVMRSPLGKIANRPQVQEAIQALFPTGGKGVSAEEVGQAVTGMARNNARAAQDLVRMHVEQVFQDATQRLQSGANQAGGPKFSQGLVGHAGEGASVEAAIKALPGGEQTWKGIRRLLDIFDAQGSRQAIGSGTTYNNAIDADLRAGKPLSEAGAAIMTGGVKLPGRIMDRIEQWRMGSGLDELAQLFTDPKMGPTFRRLATQPPNSEGIVRLSIMALDRAMRGYGMTKRSDASADPEGQPLKLSVRPRP